MNRNRQEKGITLIALVITIIILLILAGIVGYVFSKNGPIEHARYSKFVTEFRKIEESVEIYVLDQQLKQAEQIYQTEESNVSEIMLPIGNKVTEEEKQTIKQQKLELEEKIKELSGKEIEDIELYWIEQEKIGTSYKERYIIDVKTKQIYQYDGQKIYGLMWHTVDEGIKIGKIRITVTPSSGKVTEVKINIVYANDGLRQYKIGKNNTTWNEYTGEITLTSEIVMENKWENEDKTVTLYVKGSDEEGNEFIEEYVITNLDVDPPIAPVIEPSFGYPVITEYGIGYSKDNIKYDTREDIDNYYSIDNGVTWEQYTGPISLTKAGIVMAKSVKKESGLEVISTKQVTVSTDGLPIECYDGNESTGKSLSGAKLFVDKDMIGKQVRVLVYSYEGGGNVEYIAASGNKIKRETIGEGTRTLRWATITIPEGTEYLMFTADYGGSNIREVRVDDIPKISVINKYPVLAPDGLQLGFSEIQLTYIRTSIQRLYKIGNGEWQNYNDEVIKLRTGETIYVKGIDKNGKESEASSYTSILPTDALPVECYDGDESTGKSLSGAKLFVDKDMIGKQVRVLVYSYEGGGNVEYIAASGNKIKRETIGEGTRTLRWATITIPEGTEYLMFTADYGGSNIREVQVIIVAPAIVINENMTATIQYESYYNQRLYKIDDGEWKDYNDTEIQLQIGQSIYAKGVMRDGKEMVSSKIVGIEPLVPRLSSNTGANGKVTCSSVYENGSMWDGWVAFNERSSGDGWYATSSPAWIQYEFNNPTIVKRIYIYAEVGSSNSNTTGLTLQCSDDGVNYQNVMSEYTYTIGNKTYIDIEKTKSARFWRLFFTKAERVYNLQFYGI